LWVSREIVHAHGGTIVFDTADGRGTTFTVTLPRRVGDGAMHPREGANRDTWL
jgi:signal transduction histidine kinase